MKTVAIIQARMSSTRLPGKVLMKLGNKTVLEVIIDRLRHSRFIDEIVVATSTNKNDTAIVQFCMEKKVKYYQGSETNVLNRFYNAAKESNADLIVRVTSDDPFKDPELIDSCIDMLVYNGLDFCANNNPPTFPEGLDVEVFTMSSLFKAEQNSVSDFEREHVTQYFYKNKHLFKQANFANNENYSHYRLTLDTQEDFDLISNLYHTLECEEKLVRVDELIDHLNKNPSLLEKNKNVKRSQMYSK